MLAYSCPLPIKEQQSSGVEQEIMCFIFISLFNKPFQNGKENAHKVFACMDGKKEGKVNYHHSVTLYDFPLHFFSEPLFLHEMLVFMNDIMDPCFYLLTFSLTKV